MTQLNVQEHQISKRADSLVNLVYRIRFKKDPGMQVIDTIHHHEH